MINVFIDGEPICSGKYWVRNNIISIDYKEEIERKIYNNSKFQFQFQVKNEIKTKDCVVLYHNKCLRSILINFKEIW